jgi:excisionase family DNA binding protein
MSLQQRFKNKKPEPDNTRRMMSPKQAADYLGVSVDLIYEKLKSGEIPYVLKSAGRNRKEYTIDRYDLDKYIEKNKVGVL